MQSRLGTFGAVIIEQAGQRREGPIVGLQVQRMESVEIAPDEAIGRMRGHGVRDKRLLDGHYCI